MLRLYDVDIRNFGSRLSISIKCIEIIASDEYDGLPLSLKEKKDLKLIKNFF
jgi:hypothetical protein